MRREQARAVAAGIGVLIVTAMPFAAVVIVWATFR